MPSDGALPRSSFVDVDGPVHVADYGGDPRAGTIVCLHGLANSHVAWRGFAGALTDTCRVLAIDLPGHGRTPRDGRSADVMSNLDVLGRVIDHIGQPIVLVGHSMGAALALLHAVARPDSVDNLVLLAPPTPRALRDLASRELAYRVALCTWPWLARAVLGMRLRQLGPEEYVQRGLKMTCASTDGIEESTLRLLVERAGSDRWAEDHATFVEAARSVGLLVARAAEYRRAIAVASVSTLVLHGAEDKLVAAAAVERLSDLQPVWDIEILPSIGHSPHMEAPPLIAHRVRTFLDAQRRRPVPPADVSRPVSGSLFDAMPGIEEVMA